MSAAILAVSTTAYVVAAWAIVMVVVVAYALWIIARGRAVAADVSAEERRWL